MGKRKDGRCAPRSGNMTIDRKSGPHRNSREREEKKKGVGKKKKRFCSPKRQFGRSGKKKKKTVGSTSRFRTYLYTSCLKRREFARRTGRGKVHSTALLTRRERPLAGFQAKKGKGNSGGASLLSRRGGEDYGEEKEKPNNRLTSTRRGSPLPEKGKKSLPLTPAGKMIQTCREESRLPPSGDYLTITAFKKPSMAPYRH